MSRYIHRNPVESKICSRSSEYSWSSYQAYMKMVPRPDWLYTGEILTRVFPVGVESYKSLVDNPRVPSLVDYYRSNRIAPILGGKAFKISIEKRIGNIAKDPEIPEARWVQQKQQNVIGIIRLVSSVAGCSPESIIQTIRGKANLQRHLATYVARKKCGFSLGAIATAFGLSSYSTVSHAVKELNAVFKTDSELREQLAEREKRLQR